jgi:hypothetical protein
MNTEAQRVTAEQVQIINQAEAKIHAYHDAKKAQIEKRNLLCEAFVESDSDTLNKILTAVQKGEAEKVGRLIISRYFGYSNECAESNLDEDELEIYYAIVDDIEKSGIAADCTNADDELCEYEHKNDQLIPAYERRRIESCLNKFLEFIAIEEECA